MKSQNLAPKIAVTGERKDACSLYVMQQALIKDLKSREELFTMNAYNSEMSAIIKAKDPQIIKRYKKLMDENNKT